MKTTKSFEDIFNEHKNRIYYYLHRLRIPHDLQDEFYAEGLYAMWLAYKRYKPDQGALSTYLNYQIRFRLIDLIRKKERKKKATETILHEQAINLHSGNRNRNSDQLLIEHPTLTIKDESLWNELKEKLTLRQWKWVYYYIIQQMPLKEIAEKENVTVDAVKGWAKGTRHKLRQDDLFKRRLLDEIQQ